VLALERQLLAASEAGWEVVWGTASAVRSATDSWAYLVQVSLWAKEEEERRREDEEQDITKKTGDGAVASFYGNLNRNVAMGKGEQESKKENNQDALNYGDERASVDTDEKRPGLDFMDGSEPAAPESRSENESKPEKKGEGVAAVSLVSMRQVRSEKLTKARLCYFQRQGLSEDTAGQRH
jgi:hypothetical protein